VAHQNLTVLQGWRFTFHQLEVAGDGFALGAVIEVNLLVGRHVFLLKCYGFASCLRSKDGD
jgi:hypothetical protein